jgi:high-affinity K+ transport system ATPase subunit B
MSRAFRASGAGFPLGPTDLAEGAGVHSDQVELQIGSRSDKAFLDRMISLAGGIKRQRTAREIVLSCLRLGTNTFKHPSATM